MTVKEIDEEISLISTRITTLQAIKFQIKKANDPGYLDYYNFPTQETVRKIVLDSGRQGVDTAEIAQQMKVLGHEKSLTNIRETVSRLRKKKQIRIKKGGSKLSPTYVTRGRTIQ